MADVAAANADTDGTAKHVAPIMNRTLIHQVRRRGAHRKARLP
jgi:hypothetical protein